MSNMLPTPYQQFIHKSRYARWLDDEQRRENWDETVFRYTNFMRNQVRGKHQYEISDTDLFDIEQAILGQEIMPSMRASFRRRARGFRGVTNSSARGVTMRPPFSRPTPL